MRLCRVDIFVDPTGRIRYKAYAFNRVLAEIRGYGRILSAPTTAAAKPPTGRLLVGLQIAYAIQPGTSENPGLRAAISRPYKAYAFNRVLSKI